MAVAASPFPQQLTSIPAARQWLRTVLGDWGLPAVTAEDALLLANELATNAVVHARTDYEVSVELDDGCLRVEVSDRDPRQPVVRMARPEESTGRGLAIVDAIAARWGSRAEGPGKVVWFELRP